MKRQDPLLPTTPQVYYSFKGSHIINQSALLLARDLPSLKPHKNFNQPFYSSISQYCHRVATPRYSYLGKYLTSFLNWTCSLRPGSLLLLFFLPPCLASIPEKTTGLTERLVLYSSCARFDWVRFVLVMGNTANER